MVWRASKRLSTVAGRNAAQARIGAYDAFEVLRSQVLKLKQVAHELPGALRNDHAVRLRNALQARRKVRRLTYDGLLLRSPGADQVAYDHEARCDADTGLKGRVRLEAVTAVTNSSPARTARSASSSWACGYPK